MAEFAVRHATEDDDFSLIYPDGEMRLRWNLDQVFVVVENGLVVGSLIMWDAGHSVVQVAHFRVLEPLRGHYLGYRLMEYVEQYAKEHSKVAIMGMADDPAYIDAAKRLFGATVSDGDYKLLTKVTV